MACFVETPPQACPPRRAWPQGKLQLPEHELNVGLKHFLSLVPSLVQSRPGLVHANEVRERRVSSKSTKKRGNNRDEVLDGDGDSLPEMHDVHSVSLL